MTSTYILVHQNRAIRISFTTVVTVPWFWDLFVTEKQFFNVIFFRFRCHKIFEKSFSNLESTYPAFGEGF